MFLTLGIFTTDGILNIIIITSKMNDIIWRAIKRAQVPAVKEPVSLTLEDNKRPDGTTLLPWAKGKPLAWDVSPRHLCRVTHR